MKKLMGALVLAVCGILTVSAKPVWTGVVFTKSDFVPMDAADNIAYGRNGAYTDGKLEKATQTNWVAPTFSISFDGAKDIYELVTYSWWSDGGRDGYSVGSVSVKYDGDAAFTALEGVAASSYVNGGTGSVRFSLKDDADAPLARNVVAIQFTLSNLENNWIGVGEFEVRGRETTIYDLAKATVTFDPKFGTADGTDQTPTYLVTKEDGTVLTDGFTASWNKDGFVDEGVYTLTLTPNEDSDFKPGSPLVAQYRIWPENPLPAWECVQPSSPFVPMDQEENVAFGRNGKVTNGVLNKDDSTAQSAGDYTISFDGPKDIYELKVYSAWDAGRDGFGIDKVSVQYYGETGYTQLTDVPAFDMDKGWGSQCEWLMIREDLPLAKNVTAICIHFSRCDANWIGLGEIEVRGCETAVYDLDRAVITFDPEYVCYDGKERKPEVTVAKEDGTVLTDGIVLTWDPAEMVNAGIYTLTVSPAAGSAFKGSQTVQYRIWPAGGTGDPDTKAITYTWKSDVSTGKWSDFDSWLCSETPCYGIPSNTQATAKFIADADVDLDGGKYDVKALNGENGIKVKLSNGSLKHYDSEFVMKGTLELKDVDFKFNGNPAFKQGHTVVLEGNSTFGFYRPWNSTGGTLLVKNGESTIASYQGYYNGSESSANNLFMVSNAVLTLTGNNAAATGRPLVVRNGADRQGQVKITTATAVELRYYRYDFEIPENGLSAPAIEVANLGKFCSTIATVDQTARVTVDVSKFGRGRPVPLLRYGKTTLEEMPEVELTTIPAEAKEKRNAKVYWENNTLYYKQDGQLGLVVIIK